MKFSTISIFLLLINTIGFGQNPNECKSFYCTAEKLRKEIKTSSVDFKKIYVQIDSLAVLPDATKREVLNLRKEVFKQQHNTYFSHEENSLFNNEEGYWCYNIINKEGVEYAADLYGNSYKLARKLAQIDGNTQAALLQNEDFSTLPKEVLEAKQLRVLGLFNCNISILPNDFFELNELLYLNLSGNKISEINKKIAQLKHLKYLNLYQNKISYFFNGISTLNDLEYLNIASNSSLNIPSEIGNCEKLISLRASRVYEQITHCK